MKRCVFPVAAVVGAALLAGACGQAVAPAPVGAEVEEPVETYVYLQWEPQAQFGGYYAAAALGYYEDEGLDVEIMAGDLDVEPQMTLATLVADFAVAWAPKTLASMEEHDLRFTNIAQIFQGSGTIQVAMADSEITSPADLAGKKVGSWGYGNDYELLAAMQESGLDVDHDVDLIQQDFGMTQLVDGEIDAAQATTYNEYAQLLETVNPATGEMYRPDDLTVLDWNEVGTAMLQDGIWADADRLESEPEYRDRAAGFVKATLKGWIHCRDYPGDCVQFVLNEIGFQEWHQRWQMNEVNQLIWPAPAGVGTMDEGRWDQTIRIARDQGIIQQLPPEIAYDGSFVDQALRELTTEGLDVYGENYQPQVIEAPTSPAP